MAQPAPPAGSPPPVQPPPGPPPGAPVPPPGYFPYYPPPQRNRTVLIVVVVVVVFVVVSIILAAVLYVLVSGLITVPPGNQPTLALTPVTLVTVGNETRATFTVAAATNPALASEWRVTLSVDGVPGTSAPLGPLVTVRVGPTEYTVSWTDVDSDARVSRDDTFSVSAAGGLAPGRDFIFTLTWTGASGSSSVSVGWST